VGEGFPLLEGVLKDIYRDAKYSVIPPNPRATRRCARKKGGTGLKVPLFKGDLGGSSLWLLATGLFKHPLRLDLDLAVKLNLTIGLAIANLQWIGLWLKRPY
jgi:hypothetical protein